MAKFRIIKVKDEGNQTVHIIQRKTLFSRWKTLDYFSSFAAAMSYLTRRNPNYIPKPEEIIYES